MNEEKPVRIGDREREEAVARLGAHYEAGRLTAEEHQERVGEALQAKTQLDLAALFEDLPGEPAGGAGQARAGDRGAQQQDWAGPWGWARPPWTAPQDKAGAQASAGPRRSQYGPTWKRKVPLPVLLGLVVAGVFLSVACVVLGGHPPVLPFLLVVAGVMIAKSRRQGARA
ncbi:DUF1707 SHOCT-like domain-containing protein [Kribbella sp. CA-294648]|uniref:DUF1707 SHOCT-like domain-containing protein n=1 Tax=Kribbella sp. CA-294648 TaxID=3239948 RepID=UPI003D903486